MVEANIETTAAQDDGGGLLEETEKQLMEELERIRQLRNNPDTSSQQEGGDTRGGSEGADGVWEITTRSSGSEAEAYVFRLDGEEMKAAKKMPAGFAMDLVESKGTLRNLDRIGQFRLILEMLEAILWPESMDIIRRRMKNPQNPIELEDLARILNHLSTVVYGKKRPTQQSSDSSTAQPTTGTGSTAGAQPEGSTSEDSGTTPSTSTPSTTG